MLISEAYKNTKEELALMQLRKEEMSKQFKELQSLCDEREKTEPTPELADKIKATRKSLREVMNEIEGLLRKGVERYLSETPDSELIENAYKAIESITFEDFVLYLAKHFKAEYLQEKTNTIPNFIRDEAIELIDDGTDFGVITDYFITLNPTPDFETKINELLNKQQSIAREFQQKIDDNFSILTDLLEKALEQDRQRYIEQTQTPETTQYKLMAGVTKSFSFTVDKVNRKVWKDLEYVAKMDNNQIMLQAITVNEKHPDSENIYVLTSINFNELEGTRLSKKLTAYDKRVYNAVGTFWNNGYSVFSESQLWREMGNTGSPSITQLKKLHNSLTKLLLTQISINNIQETAHGLNYPPITYDGVLLPFERVTAYDSKGEICEGAIHLFREPPLYQFARERKQISTIKRTLLLSPISKTDGNLEIEDYLLERLSKMKNDKTHQRKILYSTLFENCNITEKKQKQRSPEKVKQYLDHYKSQEYIKEYKEEKDGVTIIL